MAILVLERGVQVPGGRGFLEPEVCYQEHCGPFGEGQKTRHQPAGGRIGPVQIFDRHDHRAAGGESFEEQAVGAVHLLGQLLLP